MNMMVKSVRYKQVLCYEIAAGNRESTALYAGDYFISGRPMAPFKGFERGWLDDYIYHVYQWMSERHDGLRLITPTLITSIHPEPVVEAFESLDNLVLTFKLSR